LDNAIFRLNFVLLPTPWLMGGADEGNRGKLRHNDPLPDLLAGAVRAMFAEMRGTRR
jgi:hypothetical protein